MAREVLLMANVEGVGAEGDVVTVADGHARNYLIPKKLAAPATDAMKRRLAKIRRDREAADQEALGAARDIARRLEKLSVTIPVKVGQDDKLFGSVTAADIVAAVKAQGLTLDKHQLVLDAPLKELDVFEVKVKLHPAVEATLKVWVVKE